MCTLSLLIFVYINGFKSVWLLLWINIYSSAMLFWIFCLLYRYLFESSKGIVYSGDDLWVLLESLIYSFKGSSVLLLAFYELQLELILTVLLKQWLILAASCYQIDIGMHFLKFRADNLNYNLNDRRGIPKLFHLVNSTHLSDQLITPQPHPIQCYLPSRTPSCIER
jgi:hypothetical protein